MEAFVLMIYLNGPSYVEPWGPFNFDGYKNCQEAGMVAAGLLQSGRVTCTRKATGEIVIEWSR